VDVRNKTQVYVQKEIGIISACHSLFRCISRVL